MILIGEHILRRRIIGNGLNHKLDDGKIPSRGLDGMLYTFAADVNWETYRLCVGSFLLLKTLETVNMPLDCGGLLTIKSTYGRKGVMLTTNSPVDPGYSGPLSIGLFNAGDEAVTIYGQGGLMQMTVHMLSGEGTAYIGRWQGGG